jgi:hypothetical protein
LAVLIFILACVIFTEPLDPFQIKHSLTR